METSNLEKIKNYIYSNIHNKTSRYLINGDVLTNKTNLCKEIFHHLIKLDLNPILLTSGNTCKNNEFKNIYSFFNINKYEDNIENAVIYINKKKLKLNLNKFDYKNEKDIELSSDYYLETEEDIRKLSILPHYFEKNSYFTLNNNKDVLIIDNIEDINLNILIFLEYIFRILNKKKNNKDLFFGNLKLIFVGNYKNNTINNIYKSSLYYSKLNIINFFKIINIKFVRNLEKDNIFSDLYNFYNNINDDFKCFKNEILDKKTKLYFQKYDIETKKQIDYSKVIFIGDKNSNILNFNYEKLIRLSNLKKKQIYIIPTVQNFNFLENKELEQIKKFYNYKLNSLFISEHAKIYFTNDIPSYGINKYDFGHVIEIKAQNTLKIDKSQLNTKLNNEIENFLLNNNLETEPLLIKDLKDIKIKILVNDKIIDTKVEIFNCSFMKHVNIERFPINLGWCINQNILKSKKNIENIVIVLSQYFSISLFKKCLLLFDKNKIGFLNTIYFYNKYIFNLKLLEYKIGNYIIKNEFGI